MADTQDGDAQGANAQGAAAPQPQQMPQVRILAHFVRDLSFENVAVVQGQTVQGQPDIGVQVHLDGGGMPQGNYQLNMKITAKATVEDKTRFLVELDYAGVFSIANAAEGHIHPLLFIECPRLLWPFARRVVADVTRDGGYPSLMLENIDFANLYRQKLDQMRQQNQATQAAEQNAEPAAQGADRGTDQGADQGSGEQKPH